MMKYLSTRGQCDPLGFIDAVSAGLATDGGLLLPAAIPAVSADRLRRWQRLPYPDLAAAVLGQFVGPDIPGDQLAPLVRRSYATFRHPEVAPLVPLGDDLHVLELFHGPTLAFKDIALQFLGNLFEHILARTGGRFNILGATSGDTGSAAIHGVRGKAGITIVIMHPRGRVSPVQERQMTTVLDDNVFNIAIDGTFDDGQRILKQLFADVPFKQQYHLGAVNSVNWARIAAQIVYYFHAAFRAREATGADTVQLCVPTGNFGNIFAGYLARAMGAPIRRFILATNRNAILSRFFNTGEYRLGDVTPTCSPSMDIQIASNFERYLYYAVDRDPETVRALMQKFGQSGAIRLDPDRANPDRLFAAGDADDHETLRTIRQWYDRTGTILDPHTAVGVAVAARNPADIPTVCLATAHPAKFPQAVGKALDGTLPSHPEIDALADLPTRCVNLPADREAIRSFITANLPGQSD